MLRKCSRALLLTDVENFGLMYKQIAEECDVSMRIEAEWNSNYRVTEEVIICGSKYLDDINVAYYPNVVLILKSSQKTYEFINKGITRFIFNHEDARELVYACMKADKVYVKEATKELKEITRESSTMKYIAGDYEFHFDTGKFKWKGRGIYLTKQTINYLAEWLLNGHKDNSRRLLLFNVRKKLGKEFLSDIDRFGELKEKKDEQ